MATANDSGNFGDLSDFADLPITITEVGKGKQNKLQALDEPFSPYNQFQNCPDDEFGDEETTNVVVKDSDILEIEIEIEVD